RARWAHTVAVIAHKRGQTYGAAMRRAVVACFLLIAIGCAMRPTGYVAARGSWATYGYSDGAEGGDDYSILVKANAATSDEQVAQLVLLRAAHLTLEKGGKRFI